MVKTVILTGGIGGARFAWGYANTLANESVTIIGNVADDQEFHGLWVSPDIDTLTYTMAGLEGPHGWGLKEDTTKAMNMLSQLGQPDWMTLGDADFGLHIFRTLQRKQGRSPTEIAQMITGSLGVETPILPCTDDVVQTRILTKQGELDFQTYFVRMRAEPEIKEIRFDGIETATATAEVLEAVRQADRIIIAPSNPIVSILPILKVGGLEDAIRKSTAFKLAVSPFIGGQAIKGPAVDMMRVKGLEPDIRGLQALYGKLVHAFVVDDQDAEFAHNAIAVGTEVFSADIFMGGVEGRKRVASETRAKFDRLQDLAA